MIAPQSWIALLRVVVGLWFLKAVWTKLVVGHLWGIVPYPAVSPRFLAFHPKRVAEFAAGNPVGWYKAFLEQTVLPQASLFATLQALGEVAVGVGLILGLLTGLTALVGLFLAVNYGLATLFGKRLELIPEPAATPEAALTLGLRLVRQEGAVALVGGADDGSAEALRDAAEQAGALFFNVGALSDRLRGERCHRWTF